MEEKDKPDMEGGDVALVTTTEHDYSTDEEMPSYSDDAAGMRKAYKDIQNIFAEVIRDYPEEFYPDEAEKKREEDAAAAGDAGIVDTEAIQEALPSQEQPKNEKTILGLTPASVPNFLSATKSSVAHQREPVPNRPRTSKSGSKSPAAALKKLWRKERESDPTAAKGKKNVISTVTKADIKPNTVPLDPSKSIKKQDLPATVSSDTRKEKDINTDTRTEESQTSILTPSQARVHFEERPCIKKVDLRPIDGAESELSMAQIGSKIISRRTEPVPDLTDEAIATSSELDEIVTYRMETPLEALWPIKVVVRESSVTKVESVLEYDEGGDKLSVPKIVIEQGPATEVESGFSKVVSLPSRVNTVLDNVPHDDFAAEFIKDAGIKSDKAIIESMTAEYRAPPPPPRETTALAKSVSQNLSNRDVQTSLKLVYTPPIWPHHVPLYTTLSKLPSLRSVVLDDSKIQWLRELGSSLPNLVTLSVMRCGLKSLDGVSAFPNLENLFAADNQIDNPSHLSVLRNLRFLDLSDNPIATFEGFTFLKLCTNLRCMKLMETEVAKYADFHTHMRRLIPSLRELQPKSVAIHGPGVYEMYNNQLSDDDEEDFPDETESVSNPFSALKSVAKSEEEQFRRVIHRSTGLKWREEERRLRDSIYNPDRKLFRNRAAEGVGVPKNVDEMDAYLDDLESMSEATDPSRVLGSDFNLVIAPPSGAAEASISAGNLTSVSGYTDTTSGVGAEDTASSRVTCSPSDIFAVIPTEELGQE